MLAVRLIVAGGEAPSSLVPDREYKSITAADSGYDTAIRLGLRPDNIVGDLDSTRHRDELVADGVKPMPHDKDYTDLELAILGGDGPYDLVGCGGGRLDHTLAALAAFRKYGGPERWWTDEDEVLKITRPVRLLCGPGTALSFFSLGTDPVIVSSRGLRWELDGYPLSPINVSLSNRSTGNEVLLIPDGEFYARLPLGTALEVLDA